MSSIQANLDSIFNRIEKAKQRSGSKHHVELIVVSKTHTEEDILEAYNAGHLIFGENKVQEAITKIEHLPRDIEWHMIGHLQKNKLNKAIPNFKFIHSLDSIELAEQMNKKCMTFRKKINVFIQLSLTGEMTKSGIESENLTQLLDSMFTFPQLSLVGFMTMGPLYGGLDETRKVFEQCRKMRDKMATAYPSLTMDFLSMGMSGDFEMAIEEGATHIRIGSAIFGDRHYS